MKIDIKYKIWWDKPSECYLLYCKKYKISSYGKTKKKAKIMFKYVILDILKYTRPKIKKVKSKTK